MKSSTAAVLLTAAVSLILIGCAGWNDRTRRIDGPGASVPPGESAYVESNGLSGRNLGRKYGCSFIEFDGKGGFLDVTQLKHAKEILTERATASNVLLVLYCHGWNNNAQSDDVIQFVDFLRRLSDSPDISGQNLHVEGVYLSWRGSQYLPVLGHKEQSANSGVDADFNHQDLDNPKWSLPPFPGNLLWPFEIASYFSIKDRAELHISRVNLARAVFDLAFTLKSPAETARGRKHHVFVLGHSFGALALEQTLGQASVGLLTSQWDNSSSHEDRWPFDLVVFLNSAAPSLYAKQLQGFLMTDRHSTRKPRIVSITSTGDWATGTLHQIGNLGNRYFAADLQRKYHPYWPIGPTLTAGYYYDYTPGHNKYLINGCIEQDSSAPPPPSGQSLDALFPYNITHAGPSGTFYAKSVKDQEVYGFKLAPSPQDMPSNYWIVTVPPEIIPWHTQIWSNSSMEMLAGIYSIVDHIPPIHRTYQPPIEN